MEKNCIIVGAGSGVSLSVARRFGREGYGVGLISRSTASLDLASEELRRDAIQVSFRRADASEFAGLQGSIRELIWDLQGLDVLVYNAAALTRHAPDELEPEEMMQDMRVNLGGAVAAVNVALEEMRKRKSGAILITGGGLALHPYFKYSSLAAGKAAIRSYAYSLAQCVASEGIRVATVTINGFVKKNTFFDPDAIADVFYSMAMEPPDAKGIEYVFEPST